MDKEPNQVEALRCRLKAHRLQNPKIPRRQVAALMGVGFHWLEKFEQGLIADPQVSRFKKVEEYLARSEASP